MKPVTPAEIDAVLPQTQCGLCGYGGCMPYAKAMAEQQAQINLCPPGGVDTLHQLGELLQQDPTPFLAEMQQKAKPAMVAVIREAECIGCTKCIQACPVDAIIGSAKQMHSILASECTGCELCLAPCPVDCIEMQLLPPRAEPANQEKAQLARQRFSARQQRLQAEKSNDENIQNSPQPAPLNKQAYIQAALERARSKKQNIEKFPLKKPS